MIEDGQSQTYLALTRREADFEWLQGALKSLGQVLNAGKGSLDELLSLIDVTGSSLLFVSLDRDGLVNQSALIEGVLEAKPLISVVALGDGLDNQLVLTAMRSGARDFIAYGSRSSEVAGLVRHLSKRMPNLSQAPSGGRVTALFSAQQDADAALIAAHLGIVSHEAGVRTLLLDLGAIKGDGLAITGSEASFNFGDALRNLRRLDASLIESAYCQNNSGLWVLSMGPNDDSLERCSLAELYLLLGGLRQHFGHIVLNLVGQDDGDVLRLLMSNSDSVLWYIDQSVPNCQRNLQLLGRWRSTGVKLGHVRLLVDRYVREVSPDDKALCQTFDLPLAAALPVSYVLRLNSKNLGRNLFLLAPRDALSQGLQKLGSELSGQQATSKKRWFSLRGNSA